MIRFPACYVRWSKNAPSLGQEHVETCFWIYFALQEESVWFLWDQEMNQKHITLLLIVMQVKNDPTLEDPSLKKLIPI